MPDLKLDYFDIHGGRGEVVRLILAIGGIEFEDDRFPFDEWPARKAAAPLQRTPVLHVDGEAFTQSNSMIRYVGGMAGLYPDDALAAFRCDEIMAAVEDILCMIIPTMFMEDEDEKKTQREKLAAGPITMYLNWLQGRLEQGGGEYFVENRLTVADLKVFIWIRSLRKGVLDYIPKDIVDNVAPKVTEHCERVAAHPGIVAWYEAH